MPPFPSISPAFLPRIAYLVACAAAFVCLVRADSAVAASLLFVAAIAADVVNKKIPNPNLTPTIQRMCDMEAAIASLRGELLLARADNKRLKDMEAEMAALRLMRNKG